MLNLQRTDDGFELSHAALPAPLVLTHAAGREFAKALTSPDLKVAGWKIDKLVWADPDRAPIGIWVTQAGQPQIWIMGQTIDISADDATALAATVLLETATYKVGDELQPVSSLRIDADDGSSSTSISKEVGVVTEVYITQFGNPGYKLVFASKPGFTALNVEDQMVEVPPPLSDWEVSENGFMNTIRSVTVSARSADEAKKLAMAQFSTLNPKQGWQQAEIQRDGLHEINRIEGTKEDLAYAEGWVYGLKKQIVARVDTDNNRVFADDKAAYAFVLEKALAGSKRHADAIRAASEAA